MNVANPNAPHGIQPVQTSDGNPYTGKATLYHIPASDATFAYYNGDVVALAATGSDAQGVPDITLCGTRGAAYTGATPLPVGVIVGVQVAPIGAGLGATQGQAVNLNVQFVPVVKAQDYYVWVADDPSLIFEVQCGTTIAAATGAVGLNVGFTPTAPANVTGPLSATVTSGAPATTNTLPLKIIGVPYRPNTQLIGTNTPLLVVFNLHQYGKPSPGTLGV
jgi:hypothetical protein